MQFYLGTHQPAWLTKADVPLFVSHRRLVGRLVDNRPRARTSWALVQLAGRCHDQRLKWSTQRKDSCAR